jgi:tetratricopeptide (TPR) repeat protein
MSEAMERPDKDVSYFIMPVFAEIGYLSGREQHALREELTRVQVGPEDERSKIRADYLVQSGRYTAAISAYRKILNRNSSPSSLGAQFYALVWNNLGCAYALQFRYSNAADCFLSAWKLVRSREMMRRYVSTLPLFLDEKEYRVKLESLGADPVLIEKIQEYNLKIDHVVLPFQKAREVLVFFEGRNEYYKLSSERGSTVQIEDAERMMRYLDSKELKPEYVDIRVEGKAYYK